jgi:hypothetical protein
LLAQGQSSEKLLSEMQESFAAETKQAQQRLLASTRTERAAMHQVGEVIQSGDGLESREWRDIRSDEFKFWLYMNINVRYGQALHLQLMNEAVEIAKLPLHEQRTDWKELEERVRATEKNPQTAFALLMMPAVVKIYNAHCKAYAVLNCASMSLAAERYRLAHHKWPEKLETLVPAFITEIPIDPFDGKHLRYRRLEDGIVVYSVGADEEDNGGNLYRSGSKRLTDGPPPETDLGFRLWDPDKRRQPPPPAKAEEKKP